MGGASKGIWASPATFSETGSWGAQVTLQPDSADPPKVARLNFDVRARFSAPGYDEPAVPSKSPTERDVNGDVSHICSNVPPCAACHGEQAQGAGAIPRLAGQHRSYLERQLDAFSSNARANEIMHENSKNLTAQQISQVTAFLSAQ